MSTKLKVGDKVRVMDQGLLMIQTFAPPGSKPNNEGVVYKIMEDGYVMIEFPFEVASSIKHSQIAPYPAKICQKIQ